MTPNPAPAVNLSAAPVEVAAGGAVTPEVPAAPTEVAARPVVAAPLVAALLPPVDVAVPWLEAAVEDGVDSASATIPPRTAGWLSSPMLLSALAAASLYADRVLPLGLQGSQQLLHW